MRFECSFASIARSNRLVSKITCNSAQAPGRGYFQKLVPIIAAVATAITMVAIQPTMVAYSINSGARLPCWGRSGLAPFAVFRLAATLDPRQDARPSAIDQHCHHPMRIIPCRTRRIYKAAFPWRDLQF